MPKELDNEPNDVGIKGLMYIFKSPELRSHPSELLKDKANDSIIGLPLLNISSKKGVTGFPK